MKNEIRFRNIRLVSICCLLFWGMSAAAVNRWNLFVTNYKKESFGKGTQTWQIRACGAGRIVGANKNGLLQYNGDEWQLHPLKNGLDVRSVYFSEREQRVYAGGEGEFGYFAPGPDGELDYTELSAGFAKQYDRSGGYWGIYEIDRVFYYVSDYFVAKQVDDAFMMIPSPWKIDCSGVVNGVLYVGTSDGLKMLAGTVWLAVPGSERLQGRTIRAVAPFRKGFLAATALDGLFYGEGKRLESLVTGHEDFMRRNEVFTVAVSEPFLAVGTIHSGLLLLNRKDGTVQHYSERNGLQNNTVLSLYFDDRNRLWLGLDNGIDCISLDDPFTNLYSYPYSRGAGYCALLQGDRLVLGTNRGLFYTSWPVEAGEKATDMPLLGGLSGQVWGLEEIGGDLLCLHDKGLYRIADDRAELIPGLRGAVFCSPHATDANRCWIGTYDGLFLLVRREGKWMVDRRVEGLSGWMKTVAFESPEVLWVRDTQKGMIRTCLDTAACRVVRSDVYDERKGFASLRNLYMHTVGGHIYFSSDSGFYRYEPVSDSIVPAGELNACFRSEQPYSVLTASGGYVYALSADGVEMVRWENGPAGKTRVFPIDRTQIDFIRYYETMRVLDDSSVVIPNEYGFALLDTRIEPSVPSEELFMKRVFVSYPKDSLLYTDNYLYRAVVPQIRYGQNALRFEYALRAFGRDDGRLFRYRLLPDETWSEWTPATTKEYSNLGEGGYRFEVEARMPGGKVSSVSYPFSVLPPWYRAWYAWIGYLLALIASMRFFYLFEEKRIDRKRKAELARKEQLMVLKERELMQENLRKEQEISALKSERLEQELRHKGQETANLMIHFSRKNEILMTIKQELYKVIAEMKGEPFIRTKRMLLALAGRIDSNIQSDDALKRFEEQFDLVHNNFIRRLSERHPDLSVSERKMCAYLKMNLSSKEMAPLLNLSVRGVETLRYRLRKKIGLEKEDSLTDYINTFA